MRRLSILFVAVRFPLPLRTGDRARAYHQVRLLARRHAVTLVTYLDDSPTARAARGDIERLGVRVVSAPFGRPAAAMRVLRELVGTRPLQVALFDAPAMRDTIRGLLRDESFDLIHVQLARAMPLIPADVDIPVFVDLVDALSLNMRRRAAHDRWPMSWAAELDARRLEAYEREVCLAADLATVVSAADRAALGDPAKVEINANGVDVVDFPFVRDGRVVDRLVFTGNLGYFPNVEAVQWCAQHVLPRIWKVRPACELVVAGARPHARIRALAADPRIRVVADVPHLHPWLASARVAVVPMFTGSGQLLKVLEAMASGAPVVATRRALNGLDARDQVHALVADDAEAFAAAVLALLDDPQRAERLAESARHLVESSCTWEQSVDSLEACYRRLTQAAVPTVA